MSALEAAAFAGVVAVLVTLAVERLGGRLGGILGTLPTTIVPASLGFYAAAESVHAFAMALWAVPPGMVLNAWFLWLWRVLPPRWAHQEPRLALLRLVPATLLLWSAAALLLVGTLRWVASEVRGMSWIAVGMTTVMVAWGLAACWRPSAGAVARIRPGPWALVSRGVLAATAVGLAVLAQASGWVGPLLAGVIAVFPAIFLTTMVSLWWTHGATLPVGAVGPMMLGSSSVAVYALLASVWMPRMGAEVGAVAAWGAACLVVSVPAWAFLRWRNARSG